jgi:WD40 repeat protein
MAVGGLSLFIGNLITSDFSIAQKPIENMAAVKKINLKLISEYKKNHLLDVSDDGRWLLTSQTSKPIRRYTISDNGTFAHQSPPFDDRLRVIERESGREIGSVPKDFFTYNTLFIPGTKQVFYTEPQPDSRPRDWHYKLWLPASGQNLICLETSDGVHSNMVFLDKQRAVGVKWLEGSGDILVNLSFPGCAVEKIGPIDPADPERRIRGNSNLALSPDKKTLAYDSGLHIIIRDIISNEVIKRLDPGSLFFAGKLAYTPDGKSLVVLVCASTCLSADEAGTYYLWFYDTTNYKMTRQMEVPKINTFAISPDNQLLALSYKREKRSFLRTVEQGNIEIIELATGRKLAAASHPPVARRRDNLWAADIDYLKFSPDGKYLLSSTYDTRIWDIEGL